MKKFASLLKVWLPWLIVVFAMVSAIAYSVQRDWTQKREKLLDQFNYSSAPENNAILTDDAVLEHYIATYGPKSTMHTLISASDTLGVECHNRAHQFGRMSYEVFGDEVLKLNLPECHSGFYHGAIEAYFRDNGTDQLQEKLSDICPETLNPFFMHQCKHGLGHGIMAWAAYDLPATLDYCSLIPDVNGQSSCRTGAFMENIVASLTNSKEAATLGHITRYLSGDPQYPCNVVKEEFKHDCYFLQTDRMYQLAGNYQGIVDGCSAAPEQYRRVCFLSMGRTVGGQLRGRAKEAVAACKLAPKGDPRAWCIDGVSRDTLWDLSGQDYGLELCATVEKADGKDACYAALFSQAWAILHPDQLREFCERVPENFKSQCDGTFSQ